MANITFTEASGLNDSIFGKSQAPIRRLIEKRAEAFESESVAKQVFDMGKSENWAEKVTTMTAMSGFQPVGEMGNHPWDGMKEGFSKTFEHTVWKDRFSISREMIDDSKLLDLRRRSENFVASYYRTREQFAAGLVGSAINGADYSIYGNTFDTIGADGEHLFSKQHKAADSPATTSNKFADEFSVDALSAMETAMQNFGGESGEILGVSPDTIIIPNDWALKKAVFAAIGADKDPATANNGFNYQYGRWNVIVWQYLNPFVSAGTHPWILMDSEYNKRYAGAMWFDRVDLEVTSWEDRDTNANVWDGYARFCAGFADYRAFAVGGVGGDNGTQLIS